MAVAPRAVPLLKTTTVNDGFADGPSKAVMGLVIGVAFVAAFVAAAVGLAVQTTNGRKRTFNALRVLRAADEEEATTPPELKAGGGNGIGNGNGQVSDRSKIGPPTA